MLPCLANYARPPPGPFNSLNSCKLAPNLSRSGVHLSRTGCSFETEKSPKFFPCHRSEKTPAKSKHCHTSKMPGNNPCVCHTSETPLAGLPISVHPKRRPIEPPPRLRHYFLLPIPFLFKLLRTLL